MLSEHDAWTNYRVLPAKLATRQMQRWVVCGVFLIPADAIGPYTARETSCFETY